MFLMSQVDTIREYWSFCGEIEDLDLMRFPDTGRFKGIAFITYATVSFCNHPPTHIRVCCICMVLLLVHVLCDVPLLLTATTHLCFGVWCLLQTCPPTGSSSVLSVTLLRDLHAKCVQILPQACFQAGRFLVQIGHGGIRHNTARLKSSKSSTRHAAMQEAGYEEALKCDGTDLDGQQLRVQKCMSAGQHVGKKKQAPAATTDTASPAVQQQSPAPKVIFAADFVLPAFAGKTVSQR